MKKRVLSILLVIVMVVSLLPMTTFVAATVDCPDCKGTGRDLNCKGCFGKGCDFCDASGKCPYCHGSGECSKCGGVGGNMDCFCGGSGKCDACYSGDGKCIICYGSGKCPECKSCETCGGTGKVATPTTYTYTVTFPEGPEQVYIIGDTSSWLTFTPMTMTSDTTATITVNTPFTEYKYTAGADWSYVEKDAQGGEMSNRTACANPDVVGSWAAVPTPTSEYHYTEYPDWQLKHEGSGWEWTENLEKVGEGLFKLADANWTGSGFNVKSDENPIKKDWFAPEELILGEEVIAPVIVDVYLRVIDDETLMIGVGVEPALTYAITNGTAQDAKGSITVAKSAAEGETVTVTVNPNEGYQLKSLTVVPTAGGTAIETTQDQQDTAKYTFKMPAKAVTVTAEFEAATPTVTTWSALQNAIDAATEPTTIRLAQDLTAEQDGTSITIPAGKNITIDLNGYVLNRGLINSDGTGTNKDHGSAISVAGKLTVTDSNTGERFHKFKVLESGLWVLDEDNGTEIVTGGVITGGTGTLDTGSYIGGGIMVTGAGELTIEDGNIIGNKADVGGGVEVAATSSLTMHGGTVTGNTAAEACGGIYNAGTLKMKGKIIVKENVCTSVSGVNNLGTTSPITLEATDDPWAASLVYPTKIYAALVNASNQPVAGILTSSGEDIYNNPNNQIFYDGPTGFYLTTHLDEDVNWGELEVAAVPDGYHTISLRAVNGSLSVQNNDLDGSGAIGRSGDTIFVTQLWPDTGYQFKSVSYYDGEQYTPIVKDEEGYYTFEMPDKDITVCAEYDQTMFDKLGQAVSGKSSEGVDGVFTLTDAPETGIRTVKLLTDLSGGYDDAALEVPAGKNVVFDLNGHALNRGMIQKNTEDSQWASFGKNEKGSVFLVNGTLTVIDSTPTTTHRFTNRLSDTFPLTVLDEEARSDYLVCRGGVITGGTGCLDQELGAREFNNWQEKTVGPYSGGGIFIGETGVVNLNGGTVIGNACAIYEFVMGPDSSNNQSDFGSGILVLGELNMNGSAVTNNTVVNYGGGIYVAPTGRLTMNDSTVSDNKVDGSSFGGGIYCKGGMKIKDSVISGNSTGHSGGGIAVVSTDNIEIIDSDFADNFGPQGGALYVLNSNVTLSGVKLHGNQSAERGGGILVEESNDGYYTTVLEDVDLCENIAYYDGGAIFVGDNAAVIIRNANIIGNNGSEAVLNLGELHLSGKVIIKDTVDSVNEQLVPSQNLVTINPVIIDGALDGSAIYSVVFAQNGWEWDAAAGGLTSGYTAKNPGAKVDDFFHYDGPSSLYMDLESNELVVKSVPDGSHSVSIPSIANGKITADKYVVADSAVGGARTVTLTVIPDEGYQLKADSLLVKYNDGEEKTCELAGTGNTYTFTMPAYPVTVTAEFEVHHSSGGGGSGRYVPVPEEDKNGTLPNFFVDVKPGDYFYDAVLWAVENGITNGVDALHFGPNIPITRAQVVTFLWRTVGCPVVNYYMNMSDVKSGEYYTEAVRWALSEGITKGTSDTTFSPDTICTRGQIVAFLARFAGVKDDQTGYVHGFTDVRAADYFNNAVAWAKDNRLTDGTSSTTFSPNDDCTRAQTVTFLYRWMVR